MTYIRFLSSVPLLFLLFICYHSIFFYNLIIIHLFSSLILWEFLRIKRFGESSVELSSSMVENNYLLSRQKICGFSYFVIIFFQLILYFCTKDYPIFLFFLIVCLFYFLHKIKIHIFNYFFLILCYLALPFFTLQFFGTFKYFNEIILLVLVIVISTDIGAYFFGKFIGGPKALKKISPNKTISGILGGILLAIFNSTMVFPQEINMKFKFITLIIFLSLCSQIGDFLESYFKRKYNLKESSNLIPGHGGLLDRTDGFLFLLNVVFILNLINFEFNLFFDV